MVVESNMHEFPTRTGRVLRAIPSDPMSRPMEAPKLLDVEVKHVARCGMGDQLFSSLDAKIGRMSNALEYGGNDNALQLGNDLGSLLWQVGSVITGVGGTAKAGSYLLNAGVKVTDAGLDAMRLAANLIKVESKGLGGVADIAETGIKWGGGIIEQGKPFETFVQSKMPSGTLDLNSIKNNFSTFDHLTPDMTAISSKTLDTAATTYQPPSKITSQLNSYVDAIDSFTKEGKGSQIITKEMFKSKQMQLGIPYSTTPEQMAAVARSVQYAQSKGIQIIVTRIK